MQCKRCFIVLPYLSNNTMKAEQYTVYTGEGCFLVHALCDVPAVRKLLTNK
jgi:hypothetical protein